MLRLAIPALLLAACSPPPPDKYPGVYQVVSSDYANNTIEARPVLRDGDLGNVATHQLQPVHMWHFGHTGMCFRIDTLEPAGCPPRK